MTFDSLGIALYQYYGFSLCLIYSFIEVILILLPVIEDFLSFVIFFLSPFSFFTSHVS